MKKDSVARQSPEESEAKAAKFVELVKKRPGIAAGEITKELRITRSQFIRLSAKVRESGRVFRGGDRRFARYATTQAAADAAAANAR